MRYYFDIFDGDHWTRDDVGVECQHDHQARFQAVLALTVMARDYLPNDGSEKDLTVRVRRAEGEVFTVRLDFQMSAGPALVDGSVVADHSGEFKR